MDFFTDLESLISSQSTTNASAAEVLAEVGSPTVSIAILDHGSITSKCISTVGGDAETLFQACSISKPITGMATMRLVQAGKLQLDSKIVDLLPERIISALETPHTKLLLKQVTVRHLLSHTSGISVGHCPGYAKDHAPDTATVLAGKAPANTPHVKVQGLPGYAMSYSGGGMTVLQLLLEAVTGREFPTLVKDLVLDPLGMSRSCYAPEDGEENVARAYLTGYTPCDVPWHVFSEKAAAGLWTTPTDLLKAVRAIQQSLKGGDVEGQFLQREIAREMLEEVQNTMALSWVAPKDPGNAFVHSGSNEPGWQCFVMGYADLKGGGGDQKLSEQKLWDDCGICIMTNSAEGFTVWTKVFHAITYLKRWVSLPYLASGSPYGKIPFCALGAEIDARWGGWKGAWRDADKNLVLEGNKDEPVLRFSEDISARLLPAATSSIEYGGNGKSIDLVLEGLEMMIRLGWKDGNRDIEMWYDGVPPRMVHLSRVN